MFILYGEKIMQTQSIFQAKKVTPNTECVCKVYCL